MALTSSPTNTYRPNEPARTVGKGAKAAILFALSIVMLIGILGGRVFYLQLVEGEHNRQLAENNRIRLVAKPPERGRIFDRKGNILASSRLAHAVYLWPIAQPKEKWPTVVNRLAKYLKVPAKDILGKLEAEGYNSPNLVRLSSSIPPSLVTVLVEHSSDLPGVKVEPEAVRYYPNGDIAAHVLGYTGELSAEELKSLRIQGYRPGDVIGKAGIEDAFESTLRGEWGGQQVEVDAVGKVLRVLGQQLPKPGQPVRLTLDLDLQKAAENILGERKGAIVALNPNNGEILAMVSHPNFDPNMFSGRISQTTWDAVQARDHPFVNRSLQVYPPASTFKVVTMTAALESKEYKPEDTLPTYAYLDLGGFQFWDHNKAGFGVIGFSEAMAYSSNTFFGQVGRRLGEKQLAEWSQRFGFGSPSGIELAREESKGNVPNPEWKRKTVGEGWFIGDTINMSIGQGDVQANLVQVSMMTAAVANGGYLIRPHLSLEDTESRQWRKSLDLQPTTLNALRKALRAVFEFGTGSSLGAGDVAMAGKSGTAEDPPRPNHAWFTLFAPYDQPEIVVTAFGENAGGGGSSIAGPMAAQMVEAYTNLKKQPPKTNSAPLVAPTLP